MAQGKSYGLGVGKGSIVEFPDGTIEYRQTGKLIPAFRVRVADVTGVTTRKATHDDRKKLDAGRMQQVISIQAGGTTIAEVAVNYGTAEKIEAWLRAHRHFGAHRPVPTRPQTPSPVADELAKLAALRETGVLTTEEFERQKALVLGHTNSPFPPPEVSGAPRNAATIAPTKERSQRKIGCVSVLVVLLLLLTIGAVATSKKQQASSKPRDDLSAHMTRDSGVFGIPAPDDGVIIAPPPDGLSIPLIETSVGGMESLSNYYKTWLTSHGWTFDAANSSLDPSVSKAGGKGFISDGAYCQNTGSGVLNVEVVMEYVSGTSGPLRVLINSFDDPTPCPV